MQELDRGDSAERQPLEEALVRSLDVAELGRALDVATRAFLRELRLSDAATAEALERPLRDLTLRSPSAEG